MPSLTVIIPAFQEAKNIRDTVANVLAALEQAKIVDYEILIISCQDKEGKDDGTPRLADELAAADPHLRAIRNPYVSLGYKYWQGVALAKYEYVTWVPGDNETLPESLKTIFEAFLNSQTGAQEAPDIICAFTANPEVRPMPQRILSQFYTLVVNLLFGLNLKYFNGITVHKTALLRSLPEETKRNEGFSYNAEILVRLIRSGYWYQEVPQFIVPKPHKNINFLNFANFLLRYGPRDVLRQLLRLFWRLQIKGE